MYFTHHIPDEGKSEPLLQAEGTQGKKIENQNGMNQFESE